MVFTTFTQPFLTGVMHEDVKMSSERCCVSKLEQDIRLELLALHKNILEHKNNDFRSIN